MKGCKYAKTLAKLQVRGMFRMITETMGFECYVACVQNPPPLSDFYWGKGGICTQTKCYATMPMLLFRAWATCSSTSGVRLPAENFFPLFGRSVCVTVSLFYFTIYIFWLLAGFNVFILLPRVAAPRVVAINVTHYRNRCDLLLKIGLPVLSPKLHHYVTIL